MGSSSVLAATLCILSCLYCLHTVAMATKTRTIHYTQEIRGGPNSTLLLASGTNSTNQSADLIGFGSLVVYDNSIRQGAKADSKLLGRASGVGVGVIQLSPFTKGFTCVHIQMEHIFEEAFMYNGPTIFVVGNFYSLNVPWECTAWSHWPFQGIHRLWGGRAAIRNNWATSCVSCVVVSLLSLHIAVV